MEHRLNVVHGLIQIRIGLGGGYHRCRDVLSGELAEGMGLESDEALAKGAWLAAALVLPLVFVMGVLGTVVAGQGNAEDPSAAFFYLIEDAGVMFVAAFIVLAIALVCSSVDTLQNAVVASISRDLSDSEDGLRLRYLTVGLIPIAIYLATGPTVPFSLPLSGFSPSMQSACSRYSCSPTCWPRPRSCRSSSHCGGRYPRGRASGCDLGLLSVVAYGLLDSRPVDGR